LKVAFERQWLRAEPVCFYLLMAFLILLPQALSTRSSPSPWGLARVNSGDEAHYLVQIKSLVRDGDLDVLNNYEWALAGEDDAGEGARGHKLDRHMSAVVDGQAVLWTNVYRTDTWVKNPGGDWPSPPRIFPNQPAPPEFHYSWHPEGLAVLLAPLWLLIGDSRLLEPLVMLCSALVTLVTMLFFRHIVASLTSDVVARRVAVLAAFLGTPMWHYSRALYMEPYLACFGAAAYSFALRPKARWLAGIPAGAGLLMKPVFLLVIAPIFVVFLLRRRILDVALAGIPIVMAVSYIMWINTVRYGGPLTFSIPSLFEWNFSHAFELLLNTKHGLLPFAPVAVLAFAGWVPLLRTRRAELLAMAAGLVFYFLLMSCWVMWHGGFCYGPRLLLPILPLLMVGAAKIRETPLWRGHWTTAASAALVVVSIQINALGALPYWRFWSTHPLSALF
jgi:hypothetical protein